MEEKKRKLVFAHSWGGFVGWCREQGIEPESGEAIYPEEESDLHGWDARNVEIVRGPGYFHHALWSTKDRRMLSFKIRSVQGEPVRGTARLLSALSDAAIVGSVGFCLLVSTLVVWGWLPGWQLELALLGLWLLPLGVLGGWLAEHIGADQLAQAEEEQSR